MCVVTFSLPFLRPPLLREWKAGQSLARLARHFFNASLRESGLGRCPVNRLLDPHGNHALRRIDVTLGAVEHRASIRSAQRCSATARSSMRSERS